MALMTRSRVSQATSGFASSTQPVTPYKLVHVGESSDFETNTSFFKKESLRDIFEQYLIQYPFSSRWSDEGISPPTDDCKEKAFEVYSYLKNTYSLNPEWIAPSIEEGIMLCYSEYTLDNKMLRKFTIEIDNEDLNLVTVVSNASETLVVNCFDHFWELTPAINAYQNAVTT